MGNSSSILKEEPDDIIKNIHKTANDLTDIYIQNIRAINPQIPQIPQIIKTKQKGGNPMNPPQFKKTDPLDFNETPFNVCDHINAFYKKELMNLKKVNLLYIAENLELKQDKASKAGICAAIIEHFENRMNLIKIILDSLPFCSMRISNFTSNGFCSNNDPSTNKETCEKERNEWYHVDDVVSSNKYIIDRINSMKNKYNKDLKRLLNILKKVKSDKTINSYTLDKLIRDTNNIIKNMFNTCDSEYLPIVKSIIDSSDGTGLVNGLNVTVLPSPTKRFSMNIEVSAPAPP